MTTNPSDSATQAVPHPVPQAVPQAVPVSDEDEISLLDLLLVIAENLRLLVLGPLLVAALAVGIASVLPRTWESVTLLRSGSPTLATVVTSPAVLLPVARAQGIPAGQSADEAVDKLRNRVKANFNPKDQVLTVTASADTPEAALALGNQVFEHLKLASAPTGPERARLESQVADIGRREEQLDGSIQSLSSRLRESPGSTPSDTVRSFGQLISTAHQLSADRMALAKQLSGVDESNLLQAPTLPDRPQTRKRTVIALVAAMAAGFLLLLWVFARQALRNAQADPESAGKLRQARAALRRAIGRGE